jgi:hypothetical protein
MLVLVKWIINGLVFDLLAPATVKFGVFILVAAAGELALMLAMIVARP